jgi:hypothetical protein
VSLQNLSRSYKAQQEADKAEALRLARKNNWVIRESFIGGERELMGMTPNELPLYYVTENAAAAESVSTNQVHPGGTAGLTLDGNEMIAGEWDGGDVRTTHQEFNNTGSSRVTDLDGSNGFSNHASHVAGTIIGGGVQAQAKGMAYDGQVDAYDWNSDDSEMAAAAANGLLISNHSYGYITGWYWNGSSWEWYGDDNISDEEDYHFGFYGSKSQAWDEIAHDAPYYLIVKSAGNDRGDGPENGAHPVDGGDDGFDCIGWQGNAKNILTVAAVKDVPGGYSGDPDAVEMTSFSSWGPSDDGRIKPDISGNGYTLYSSTAGSDEDYSSYSGTSMAAPNVTGSLLLLQEHYNEIQGDFMKSATLKALAIHTADETGPHPGPDYMFGWGLLNTQTAAEVISNRNVESFISEESLEDGDTFTLNVEATSAEPLIVTVVWADVPGTPVDPQLDPADPMLVNDLDVSVTASTSGDTFYPWKLNGQNPSEPATTGVNDIDNVEKVFIADPQDETYSIEVTHKNNITGGIQDFSIIISGISYGLPVVTTGDVTGVTQTTAEVAGEVVSDNGNAVTERGFVYNQTGSPTISDNKLPEGSGTGAFTSTLSDLAPGNTYYVRAYATNSYGTAYGDSQSFTTLCEMITVLPFEEDFSLQELPVCWQNIDHEGSGQTWLFVSGGYQLGGSESFNATTESNGFAVLDSDAYGSGNSQNADLITPEFNLSEYSTVTLSFEHYFKHYSSSTATLSYSTDGGSAWTEIQSWSGTSTQNAESWSEDLSAELAGEPSVLIKWNYTGSWGYYWALDDIAINGEIECTPPSTQATAFSADAVNENEITISWTPGDGDKVLVLAREEAAVEATPVNGTAYTADNNFGEGDIIGTENYAVYNGSGNTVTITNLTEGTGYHFALFEYFEDTYCYLEPALTGNATTTGIAYCESYATETGFEYISNVNLEEIDNDSGDSGYSDFTNLSADLTPNQSYTLTVDVDEGLETDEVWGWIDWNQDGDFLDADETLYFDYTAISGAFTATTEVEVPEGADPGTTMMRISLADGGTHSCGIFSYGEVEDYSVNVAEAPQEYTVTFNVTNAENGESISGAEILIDETTLVTDASGQASITLVDGTYSYTATADGYEEAEGSVTVQGSDMTEEVELIPIPPEEYTVTFVVTDAESGESISGAEILIDGTTLITGASGQASITLVDGTYSYTATADGYFPSEGTVVVAGSNILENVALEQDDTSINQPEDKEAIRIYPNPSGGIITIVTGKTVKETVITVRNIQGEEVYRNKRASSESQRINLSHLVAGTYSIEIKDDHTTWHGHVILK